MSSGKQTTAPVEFKPHPCTALFRGALGAMACGAALSGLLLSGRDGAARFASCYLLGYAFIWTIALGCLLLVSLHHLTHAVWSVVVRRAAEALAEPMWIVAILFLPILAFGLDFDRFRLYPWTSQALVAADPLLAGKGAYLNLPFFAVRAGLFFAIWIGFARFFIGESLRQDRGESGAVGSLRLRRWSAPFVVLFGFTASFAAVDWLMSLDPHWSSTIFGVYVFAGMALVAMSAIALLVLWLEKSGRLGTQGLNDDHIYTLSVMVFLVRLLLGLHRVQPVSADLVCQPPGRGGLHRSKDRRRVAAGERGPRPDSFCDSLLGVVIPKG